MSVTIRAARADDFPSIRGLLEQVFGERITDIDAQRWQSIFEAERYLCAEDEGLLVGAAGVEPLRLTVPGGAVTAGGVTAVGVLPTHRRRGILRTMMSRQLADMRAAGEPVAMLWASQGAIYQRFGYGLATVRGAFELPTAMSGYREPFEPVGRVRLLERAAFEPLAAEVYERLLAVQPGAWARDAARWAQRLDDLESDRQGDSAKCYAIHERDGIADGYAVYRLHPEWDERGPKHQVRVEEAVALDPGATRDLWRYLCDIDLATSVRYRGGPGDPALFHLLAEPRAMSLTVTDGAWLRPVDVVSALEARAYGAADRLTFALTDPVLADNEGRYRLATDGDRARVERLGRGDGEVDLSLSVAELGALYLAGTRLGVLAAAGRVKARDRGVLERAERLFAWSVPAWMPMGF